MSQSLSLPLPQPQPSLTRPAVDVLVVSTSLQPQRTLGTYLQDIGYAPLLSALPARTMSPGLAAETVIAGMVQVFHPRLLLLDIDFGEERAGRRLLQALHALPATAALPCVVLIAAIDLARELLPQLLSQGLRVVYKPYARDELLRCVWAACPPSTPAPPVLLVAPNGPTLLEDVDATDSARDASAGLPLRAGCERLREVAATTWRRLHATRTALQTGYALLAHRKERPVHHPLLPVPYPLTKPASHHADRPADASAALRSSSQQAAKASARMSR